MGLSALVGLIPKDYSKSLRKLASAGDFFMDQALEIKLGECRNNLSRLKDKLDLVRRSL